MSARTIALLVVSAACALGSRSAGAAEHATQGDAPRPQADSAVQPAEATPAIGLLLDRQEGDPPREWPYEGVYRVGGAIPIGYRVGGTSIVALALLEIPGYAGDTRRSDAVERALEFVIESIEHPLMRHRVESGYDVRGWGYTYGLELLLACRAAGAIPEEHAGRADDAIRFFVAGLEATAIPQRGGWNYARTNGFDQPASPSPFMTAPTIESLAAARKQGFAVDERVLSEAIQALERARTPTGSFQYAGDDGAESKAAVPGSIGRMVAGEVALFHAGRSGIERVRAALDAFIVHWQWLEERRRKDGTHAPPHGIAPYYFFYAHYYAAQAASLLPAHERAEYHRRLDALLIAVRDEDGTWNDRVFSRSAAYGTAMAIRALLLAPTSPASNPVRAE